RKTTACKIWQPSVTSLQDRMGGNDPDQKMHTYEVRPREDHHGVDLISHMLPFGRLLYLEVREAVAYAKFYSRSQNAVIRVYDDAGNVIETHDQGRRKSLPVF
ncbi:MAG TPA: hypothetical protein VK639_06995, partial [Terriglobales bacterium]|nr:hypothetical protein [Terriglobales bacterium]